MNENKEQNKLLSAKAKTLYEKYYDIIKRWETGSDAFERALASAIFEASHQECPVECQNNMPKYQKRV